MRFQEPFLVDIKKNVKVKTEKSAVSMQKENSELLYAYLFLKI